MRTALVAMLFALGACHWGYRPHPDEGRYLTGEPEDGWKSVNPGSADNAWFNQADAASIYTDSNCGKRFEDNNLESMLDHLTQGIRQGDPTRDLRLELANRDALVRSWEGVLDGAIIHIGAMVLKRNDCVYDALFIAPVRSFEENWPQFEQVYSGFKIEGK
jgi:hypothetical protein